MCGSDWWRRTCTTARHMDSGRGDRSVAAEVGFMNSSFASSLRSTLLAPWGEKGSKQSNTLDFK